MAFALVACGGSASPEVIPTLEIPPATATAPDTEPVQVVPSPESATGPNLVRLEFAEGTGAVYLVNEQLARVNLPSDAIGTTDAVSGVILLGSGNLIPAEGSELPLDLSTLTSDSDRRDRYVRRNTLSTIVYPFAVLVPRKVPGLPSPLPTQGGYFPNGWRHDHARGHQRVGLGCHCLLCRGGNHWTGTTEFPFDKFGMMRPRVRLVLSVEDRIRLRIDFHLVRSAG